MFFFLTVKLSYAQGNLIKYILTFGIALHLTEILCEQMKKIDCYVISFDESLNDMIKDCHMDILFRFFELKFTAKIQSSWDSTNFNFSFQNQI